MGQAKEEKDPGTKHHLKKLLSDRNQHADRAVDIDREICDTFTREVAMLVLDMSGFSRLTAEHGIIHFLAMIHQMEQGATPAISGNGGRVIKQEADNLFALFMHPLHAMEAALDILRAFDAMNAVVPESRAIRVSIGIGFGDTLVIESDMFGEEMNFACKLGEDVARADEILLTPAAHDALPVGRYDFKTATNLIGGKEQHYYHYEGRA